MTHLGLRGRAPANSALAVRKSGRDAAEVPQFVTESTRAEGTVGLVEREPSPDCGLVYDDHRHSVDMRFRSPPVGRQSTNRGRGQLDQPITGISTDAVNQKGRRGRTQEEDPRGLLVLLNVVQKRNGDVPQRLRSVRRGEQSIDHRDPFLGETLHDFFEQLFPRREVIVKRGRRHSGPFDNIGDGNEVPRLQRKQVDCRLDKILPTRRAVRRLAEGTISHQGQMLDAQTAVRLPK